MLAARGNDFCSRHPRPFGAVVKNWLKAKSVVRTHSLITNYIYAPHTKLFLFYKYYCDGFNVILLFLNIYIY
jgi:hypothetical protein